MNKIILLITLIGFNAYAQRPIEHTYSMNSMFIQQLQNQKIESLENQVDKAINHQTLRKQVLDSQENTISWWLSLIAIAIVFGGVFNHFVTRGKIKEFKQLNKDAQEELEKIKQHEKTAKQGAENISKLSDKVKQTLLNPKKTLSKEILKEVNQSGTKLEKMTAEARQLEKSGKIQAAIDLWQQILGITKYQSNKERQAEVYFYLGYLYGENAIDYEKSIAFSNKAIEIKPNKHGAYNNMGASYARLGKHQQALEAYQKAIKIKPDDHGAYYNIGNAYDAMKNFDKAIDNYNTALKINPSIGKEIDLEDWKILTHRIKTLNDPTIKQQYQDIFNQLKGEQNKK